jgi:hypothetical protein
VGDGATIAHVIVPLLTFETSGATTTGKSGTANRFARELRVDQLWQRIGNRRVLID